MYSIQENSEEKLYIVCPKYKDDHDVQIGGTESQDNSEKTLDTCCIRGLLEEFQITAENSSAIESREDLAYNAGSATVKPYFLNISTNSIIHSEVTRLPVKGKKFYGNKTFMCVYGNFEDIGRVITNFNSSNCMAIDDKISSLIMIPLSEIMDIWDYHDANPASRDHKYRFKRTPRRFW